MESSSYTKMLEKMVQKQQKKIKQQESVILQQEEEIKSLKSKVGAQKIIISKNESKVKDLETENKEKDGRIMRDQEAKEKLNQKNEDLECKLDAAIRLLSMPEIGDLRIYTIIEHLTEIQTAIETIDIDPKSQFAAQIQGNHHRIIVDMIRRDVQLDDGELVPPTLEQQWNRMGISHLIESNVEGDAKYVWFEITGKRNISVHQLQYGQFRGYQFFHNLWKQLNNLSVKRKYSSAVLKPNGEILYIRNQTTKSVMYSPSMRTNEAHNGLW